MRRLFTNFWVRSAIIFILAVSAAWFSWNWKSTAVKPLGLPRYYFVKDAPLPPGFPQQFILGNPQDMAVATTSFRGSAAPGPAMTDERIIWDSPSLPKVLHDSYNGYFARANWTATEDSTDDSSTFAISATNNSSTAKFTVEIQPSGSGGSSVYMIYQP